MNNIVFLLFANLFCAAGVSFSQSPADTTAKKDTSVAAAPAPAAPAVSPVPAEPAKPAQHSVITMEFLKEKVEHSPDSAFFNILKITNNNGSNVQGVVKISAPIGWKVISDAETNVNISPGTTTYIPVRVSVARLAVGGASYLINATLNSSRSLFPDKNQTSVSKACYITIPQKVKWDMQPETRQVYFDRYTQSAPMKIKLTNKGNGNQVVKLEFDIGSSLEMYGALGRMHFMSVEVKPHRDTVLVFPVRYRKPDESLLMDRDLSKLYIKVKAVSDTITKKASVSFKYLESSFYNNLFNKQTPLTIEFQLQNLLSDVTPRALLSAWGFIWLKNDNSINYDLRIPGIAFTRYKTSDELGTFLWQRSRFRAQYQADRWEVTVGDISSNGGMGMLTAFGRGISGTYDITNKQRVGAALAATPVNPIYSGNLYYSNAGLPRGIMVGTSLTFVADNFNKLNIFGADVSTAIPFLPGQYITASVGVTQTQHNYDSLSFTDVNGLPILTNDPNTDFLGFGARLGYTASFRKFRGSLMGTYTTPHYSQYFGSRMMVNGDANYFINKKYFLVASSNLSFQDPKIYNRGVLIPENKYLAGRHKIELANRINSRLTFFAGPFLDHISQEQLKIGFNGDSTYTRFRSVSPQLSLRVNYKTGSSGYVTPYALLGYTFITDAEDSTLGIPSPDSKNVFYHAKAGLNLIQNNWGVNVYYYYGPHDLVTQSDYYYFGNYSKSIRIMPYFQKYFFNKLLLVSSYNSYYYEAHNSVERLALNARLSFMFERDWTLFVDNNLYMYSRIDAEGTKIYGRSYYLNVGFRKSFDIPQPRVKYYDLKIICFKDVNGNKIQDDNEQGLPDILIGIDRTARTDSATGQTIKMPGQFIPVEMVTDNFGQVVYYHIPEGEINANVVPLANLSDLYNINGQKQKIYISRDTTYYIPFAQSYRATGRVIVNRDEYSSQGAVSTANIRISATDSLGNSFPTLTGSDGSYTIYVPQAGTYKITINHVFGDQFFLQESEYEVSFNGAKDFHVDFIFNEKKRQMNINGGGNPNPAGVNGGGIPAPATNTVTPAGAGGSGSLTPATNTVTATAPGNTPAGASGSSSETGVTYRVQIGASATKVPPSQYAAKFKGAENVKEYVENGVYKYTAGEFKTWEFDQATEYKEKLIAQGYKDAFVAFFKDGKRIK